MSRQRDLKIHSKIDSQQKGAAIHKMTINKAQDVRYPEARDSCGRYTRYLGNPESNIKNPSIYMSGRIPHAP